ncbi:hypothetical protein Ciccas_011867 [Cichlidogyrus casuarinus]|uniref:Uncharacterized protein n=1 Tax=Cichlidogyrus casuarinus TaxID=1844966 RepID=A0ABD2PQJ0_9PLAT
MVAPPEAGRCTADTDSSVSLLRQKVGHCVPFVNVSHAPDTPCMEQHPLGCGRLACVNVGNNTDIASYSYTRFRS